VVDATGQAPLSYGIPPPAFRLPHATHVGTVHLQVSDLRQSLDFYEHVLGFRSHDITNSSAALSAYGDERTLVTLHSAPGVRPARRGAFGLYHFAILLPDRAALGRFAIHLASLEVRVATADHLVSEALYLWDSDGLGIEVYVDRPRDSWQQRGHELAMTTDPLNIQSVIASGRGERWDGVPSGTTMGHVHLHVGSLDRAEAFYHRGLGLDKTVWSYPGALFMSAGGYHHHLATNTWSHGPSAAPDQARLLEWELIVPTDGDVAAVVESLQAAGHRAATAGPAAVATDPWDTRVRIRSAR
jgi:catechol 2,3-dioxygenase